MIKYVPTVLLIAVLSWLPRTSWGQEIPYSWAKTINGVANDTVTDIVAGKGEYLYACGHFTSASVQLGSQTLSNSGVKDIFVAKYDSAGALLWAKKMGGSGEDKAVAIATDSLDNIYITGRCGGNASFGTFTFTGTNFIAKLNANGDVLWVTEPATNVIIYDIAADPAGNTVICGAFTGNCTIGGAVVAVTEEADGFVARYNTTGNISWYKQLYGLKPTVYPDRCSVNEVCTSVAIAPNGRIGLGGYTGAVKLVVKSTAGIDSVFNTAITLYEFRQLYGTVGFLMQWDATGNLIWIKDNLMSSTYGMYQIYAHSIATDANANLYVGYERLKRELVYTPHEVRLAKYDNTGSLEWAKLIGYYDGTYGAPGINNPRVAFGEGKVYLSEKNTHMGNNNAGLTRVHCYSQYGTLRWQSVYCGPSEIYALAAKETVYAGGISIRDIYSSSNSTSFANLPITNIGGSNGVVAKADNYIPPIVPLGFSAPNPDKTICAGGSIGLTGNIVATGGVEPYTYSWAPATSLNNATLLNAVASPTTTTQYILTVTDAQGWQLKDTVVVNVQPPLPKPTIQLIRGVAPSMYDTLVCISPATGLNYRWEYSSYYQGEIGWYDRGFSVSKITITQNASTRFRVTISNGLNGCTITSDVFYYSIVKANAGRDTTVCSGQNVTLGGTPPYFGTPAYNGAHLRYYWHPLPYTNNAFIAHSASSPYVTVSPTVTTDYLLFLDDGSGIPKVADTVRVNVVSGASTPTVTTNGPTTFCQGDSVILTSSPAQTYRWSNGATTQSIKVTASGTYSLIVGNGGGCNSFNSVPIAVTVHPRPDKPIVGTFSSPHICLGDSVRLSTPQTTDAYLWSNGATVQQPTVYTTGNYFVQTLNALGCKSVPSDTIAVTARPRPAIPTVTANRPFYGASTVINLCLGDSVTLTASASPGYMWNGSNGNTQSITVKNDGIYFVWAIDGGCMNTTASEGIIVFAHPTIPVPTITASGPTSFCQGGSVTLTASTSDGYLWSNGATTQSITVNSSGNYGVRAVVGYGTCQGQPSAATTVTVQPAPTAPTVTASGPTSFCQGGSVTLTASAASGYLWSNGATTQSITVSSSGNYSVKATNANGCQSASSVATNVTVNPTPATPVISTSGPITFCQGGSVALTASTASAYLWSNGATTQSIAVNNSGSFTVRVTNASGCQSVASAATTVTVLPAPATPAIAASGPVSFCQGGNVVLTSSAGNSYAWSNGATTPSITVNNSGSYTVQVTNASGCQSVASAATTVTVLPAPATPVIAASGPVSFCQGGNVVLTSSAGNSYTWSNGATTPSITVSNSGSHTVRVTNANGCPSAVSAITTVTVHPLPAVPSIAQSGNTLSSSAASGNQWFFNSTAITGATAPAYTYSIGGLYSVTVTTINGCSSSSAPYTALRMASGTSPNSALSYHQVAPNPMAQQAIVRYQLSRAATVSVYLTNSYGLSVLNLVNQQQQAAGIYNYPLTLGNLSLPGGNYYLVYVIDGEKTVQQIVVD
jgi:hypothetical protein